MDRTRERILYFIKEYKEAHNGNSPTYQEIADAVGLASKSPVSHHIGVLIAQGYVKRTIGSPRSLELVTPAPPADNG